MLDLENGTQLVQLARKIIETYLEGQQLTIQETTAFLNQHLGVFVTIHTFPSKTLRGCIGIPEPIMKLKNALIEAAQSATRDPRFHPLQKHELDKILIEVTVLTKPELIKNNKPEEYLSNIEVGRDGLIAEQGYYKGLLLPQVPIEQGWNVEEFLSHTCMKAGLRQDAWHDENTKIYKFSGQVFAEIEPKGEIKEKPLNGTNN